MPILQFHESGAAGLVLSLQRLEAEFSDWKQQFEKLAPESTVTIQRVFEQEGPGWLALVRTYAAQKAKKYPGKTILRRTDKGYLSFAKDASGNVTRIEALWAEYGSAVSYLVFHQDTRTIIKIKDSPDEDRYLEIVARDKTENIRALGFTVH